MSQGSTQRRRVCLHRYASVHGNGRDIKSARAPDDWLRRAHGVALSVSLPTCHEVLQGEEKS